MTDLIRLVLELLHTLSPARIVWHWQRGLYFVAGKCVGTVNPGIWPVVPFLTDVRIVNIVPEIQTTPLQTITLRDGSTLTYSASLTIVVRDPFKAFCTLDKYEETIVELAARMLSEGLAEAQVDRFSAERGKRDRLIEEQRKEINAVCSEYGLEVTAMGLNNFAHNVRTVRLLLDGAVLGSGKFTGAQ